MSAITPRGQLYTPAEHKMLVDKAVAAERERCAKLVDDNFGVLDDEGGTVRWKPDVMLLVAAAIRGQT